ncbi:ShlB/FhaC/HecB family hemolysin secretion/activation protein [Poseidonocella sp. HB161398]|uniref:ShlB/FhaC/HecB family hemolysin secretion/activation protein n=1 Tax=Poseidonocella sp. HB161398 TaxID=2320855 RepID=UPI001486B84D|nr:ShlB/FhaC/HecB family hemolysin secretion/activation protein [Poseidonocella sp. HB161398]
MSTATAAAGLGRFLPRKGSTAHVLAGRAFPFLSAMVLAAPVTAQSFPQVERVVAGQTTILDRFTPPPQVGSVDITVQDQRARVEAADAEAIRFALETVAIAGNTTLPAAQLAPIWQDRLGTEISLADLYRIAEEVDAAYLRAGYFSHTVVPVQDYADGNVRLRVYEGYVQRVEIDSAIPGIDQRLKPYIDRILAMHPIRVAEAERALLLMSDLGGLEIQGTLIRPETPSGGGVLKLEVGFSRSSGQIVFDNFGSDEFGPLELSTVLAVHDLTGRFDTLTMVGATVPDDPEELALLQLAHDVPVGHDGHVLGYSLTYLKRRPGGSVEDLEIDAVTRIASAYVSYPFLRRLQHSLTGRAELTFRGDTVNQLDEPEARSNTGWATLGLRYDRELEHGALVLGGEIGQGFDLGDGTFGDPSDYQFGRANLEVSQSLGEKTGLVLRAAGQYAPMDLPAAVDFAVGGEPYGWVFDSGALSGESGAGTELELSRDVATGNALVPGLSFVAFADYGRVWHDDPGDGPKSESLGSAGLGLRGLFGERVSFELLAAAPWHVADSLDDPGGKLLFRFVIPL